MQKWAIFAGSTIGTKLAAHIFSLQTWQLCSHFWFYPSLLNLAHLHQKICWICYLFIFVSSSTVPRLYSSRTSRWRSVNQIPPVISVIRPGDQKRSPAGSDDFVRIWRVCKFSQSKEELKLQEDGSVYSGCVMGESIQTWGTKKMSFVTTVTWQSGLVKKFSTHLDVNGKPWKNFK
jgi:hypothetical protein